MKLESFNEVDQFLIQILKPQLVLLSTNDASIQAYEYKDELFEDTGLGEVTGFYDWLRTTDEKLIGIRYMPMWKNKELLPQSLDPLSYADVEEKRNVIHIYFGNERGWNPEKSIDGEWGGNWVFRSSQGFYAFFFSMENLSESNRIYLLQRSKGQD